MMHVGSVTTWLLVLVVIGCVAFVAVGRHRKVVTLPASVSADGAYGPPVPAGELRASHAVATFGIYHLSPRLTPVVPIARTLLQQAGFTVVESVPSSVPSAPLAVVLPSSTKDYPPPSLTRNHGLSPRDQERLRQSPAVTVLKLVLPRDSQAQHYRAALTAVRELARETDSVVYDVSTRAWWSANELETLLTAWNSPVLDVPSHIVLDATRDGELVRIVSRGMEKLGLPDVVVQEVAPSEARDMAKVMNLLVQTMWEHSQIARAGELPVPVQGGTALVALTIAKPTPNDPRNRLLRLSFPGPAATLHVRQSALLTRILGRGDRVTLADHEDPAHVAATARAQEALARLKPRMTPQPPWREQLLVKLPFATPDGGQEWMWMGVLRWEGTRLRGTLQSAPVAVAGLQAGARVEGDERDVCDYVWHRVDGTTEGNETERALASQGAQ